MTPQELTARLADNPDLTIEGEYTAATETTTPRRHKYNAVATEVDGIRFDSKAEARHYELLRMLEKSGGIQNLELQPRYPLVVNGVKIAEYRADFRYIQDGRTVVCDVKGVKTYAYTLKKNLMFALYGIEVLEVKA